MALVHIPIPLPSTDPKLQPSPAYLVPKSVESNHHSPRRGIYSPPIRPCSARPITLNIHVCITIHFLKTPSLCSPPSSASRSEGGRALCKAQTVSHPLTPTFIKKILFIVFRLTKRPSNSGQKGGDTVPIVNRFFVTFA